MGYAARLSAVGSDQSESGFVSSSGMGRDDKAACFVSRIRTLRGLCFEPILPSQIKCRHSSSIRILPGRVEELVGPAIFVLVAEINMDRIERPKTARSRFANQGELPRTRSAESDTPTGRQDHLGLVEASATVASEIGKPRSEVTGQHDAGSGADETVDGLTDTEETLRRAAEEAPSGQPWNVDDDAPVFDRGMHIQSCDLARRKGKKMLLVRHRSTLSSHHIYATNAIR
jgi:hypothetical protein